MKKIILISLIFTFTYSFIAAAHRSMAKLPRYGDKIIVQYKDNITSNDINLFKNKHNVDLRDKQDMITLIENIHHLTRAKKYLTNLPFSVYQLQAADKNNLENIVKDINSENIVLFAQPDHFVYALYTPQAGPNDTFYQQGCQWGFSQIQADTAFNAGLIDPNKNKTIIVAVLDTGLLSSHPDMLGRITNGANMVTPSASTNDDNIDSSEPIYGHGTHVAGIIAANTNNGTGIAGTAYLNSTWAAKILVMPVKVLYFDGNGEESDIISGIYWAVNNGAKVLNCSFGEPQGSDALQNAINYAYNQGCINVAAAGNGDENNNPINTSYPAAYPNVIAVAATDQNDQPAPWSNYGKIDVAAPGVSIMSCNTNGSYDGSYSEINFSCDGIEMDGTSFSTPFVSGLAALLLLKYDDKTPDQIINIIEQSADDVYTAGYDNRTGWGRINVYRALSGNLNTPSSTSGITTYNWPNPFSPTKNGFTNITFIMQAPANVKIEIYDGGGNLVWSQDLQSSNVAMGYNFVHWNGTNSSGKQVANGTYFYLVKSQNTYGKNKIAVLY